MAYSDDTTFRPRAIETIYNGYRFRSRLEARWAVFFDRLGVRWEYEKEGFELGEAGRYLPDFWLPGQEVWVEIKGQDVPESDIRKCVALAEQTQTEVVLFSAQYGFGLPRVGGMETKGSWGVCFWRDHYDDEGDFGASWVQCRRCDRFLIDWTHYWDDHVKDHEHQLPSPDGAVSWYGEHQAPALERAYDAAKAARFEFGEHG